MIRSFVAGVRQASGSWKMILLLLVVNVIFALPLAVPVFLLMVQTAGGTLFAERLYAEDLNAIWFSDLLNGQFADASPATLGLQFVAMLAVLGVVYLIVNTMMAGGILEVFTSADRRFTMRKFWAGCGAYFWRFFRLAVISLIFYGIAIGGCSLLMWRINKADSKATLEQPGAMKSFAALLLLVFLISVVNMIFDYARIGAATNGRHKMFRETFKAARWALRHFVSAFGLYVIIGLTGLILFAVFFRLRGFVNQASLGAIVLAAVTGELAMASRMWTRLTYYAAQINLYQLLVPAITPAAAGADEASTDEASSQSSPV